MAKLDRTSVTKGFCGSSAKQRRPVCLGQGHLGDLLDEGGPLQVLEGVPAPVGLLHQAGEHWVRVGSPDTSALAVGAAPGVGQGELQGARCPRGEQPTFSRRRTEAPREARW